jgi:hypothetical protein
LRHLDDHVALSAVRAHDRQSRRAGRRLEQPRGALVERDRADLLLHDLDLLPVLLLDQREDRNLGRVDLPDDALERIVDVDVRQRDRHGLVAGDARPQHVDPLPHLAAREFGERKQRLVAPLDRLVHELRLGGLDVPPHVEDRVERDHVPAGDLGLLHARADALVARHESQVAQLAERLADRVAAHAELLAQLGFGGQQAADAVLTRGDRPRQQLRHRKVARLRILERIVRVELLRRRHRVAPHRVGLRLCTVNRATRRLP